MESSNEYKKPDLKEIKKIANELGDESLKEEIKKRTNRNIVDKWKS